jgi:class 3 adenylate cyclase
MSENGPALLVVDDNEDNRYTLTRRLKREGYTNLAVAENGQQALEQLAEKPFDLVLLDVMMPEMDGYQVLERLKSDEALRHIPVIMISSLDEMDSVVKCIELGAMDYLPKPFNPVLLKARIGACLEKKQLHDAVLQQLDFIREVFGKYVPDSVAEAMVASRGNLKPSRTTATILYSDIAGFTNIAESLEPEQVVQMLNEYFPAVIEPITRYGGIVNQLQGDAMLVTFNVPIEDKYHADNAVTAAQEMQEILEGRTFAGTTLRTRIGINTGAVIAGNVGSGDRVSYTVHGDAVNLAARLEQLNKEHDTLVLISGATVTLLRETYPIDRIGEVAVRGKTAPVEIYKLAV